MWGGPFGNAFFLTRVERIESGAVDTPELQQLERRWLGASAPLPS